MDNSRFWWQAADAPGPGPGPGDPIGQSLRFRRAQHLQGPALTSTLGVQTWSMWFKRGRMGSESFFLTGDNTQGWGFGYWNSNPLDRFGSNAGGGAVNETQRDPSAWYHLVVSGDPASNTQWLNGVQLTGATTVIPSQWAAGLSLVLGTVFPTQVSTYGFDGYMADVHFIDGQALDPTTFGRFNANGVWVPVDPQKDGDTAWYGANGFHLTFADPANVGKDYSGNGNDFSPTGFELADTSNPTYDLMQDSPTQNFATFNPLVPTTTTETDANLTTTAQSWWNAVPTIKLPESGKFYWEKNTGTFSASTVYGLRKTISLSSAQQYADFFNPGVGIQHDGNGYINGVYTTGLGPNATSATDAFQFAYDADSGKYWVALNGVWFNGGDPAAGTGEGATVDPGSYFIVEGNFGASSTHINFGQQQPFAYTPPAGFEALQTANMPEANLPDEITGTFTGNSNADGPFVYTGCIPGRIQYGTVDVTYDQRLGQTDVDFLSNGFKLRSTTSNSGTVNYTVTTTHTGGEYDGFKVPFQSPAPAVSN